MSARILNVKEVMEGIDDKCESIIAGNGGKGLTIAQVSELLWRHHATDGLSAYLELIKQKPEFEEVIVKHNGVIYLNKDQAMALTAYYALGMNAKAAEDAANAITKVEVRK